MSIGWISIHRKIQECFLWVDKEPFDRRSAWIDLLLLANHEDKKTLFDGKAIVVNRGQRITSIRILAERWHWSRTKVTSFLDLLESENMIVRNSDKKKTLLTIVNYGVYQDMQATEKPLKSHTKATEKPLKSLNNNDNNDNNDNNINPPLPPFGGNDLGWDFDKHTNVENTKHFLNSGAYAEAKMLQDNPELWTAVKEWMAYKDARKPRSSNRYVNEKSLVNFLNKVVRHARECGVDTVVNVINDTMGAGYQGVVWDWCFERRGKQNKAADQLEQSYDMIRKWAEGGNG